MKAIYIKNNIWETNSLNELNEQLKDCYGDVVYSNDIYSNNFKMGSLIIINTQTRKDKLDKLNEISK